MEFRIADTFTDSLSRLTGDEQRAAKTTAFDLQVNPTGTGHGFHKLEKSKDKNFWSVKVNSDIRLIVHKTQNSLLLCYVDHHDKAYDWAERRKLETHPKTGAAQLVEIRETVSEIMVPVYKTQEFAQKPKPLLFKNVSNDELLSYGVPAEWLSDVRGADEDSILVLADRLPSEAAEALLELATGGKPRIQVPNVVIDNPFDHPDALRRFRVMSNIDELRQALDFPWEKWSIFLHPEQRQWVDREYSGPARVSGSAGTGKTIVALHRAVHLAKIHPDSRVLLTTFSDTLAKSLKTKLNRLIGSQPRLGERIDVYSINAIGSRLASAQGLSGKILPKNKLIEYIDFSSKSVEGHKFTSHFLLSEWDQIVDAWQIDSWEGYRDVARLGRKTRLPEVQRSTLWKIFEGVKKSILNNGFITESQLFAGLANLFDGNQQAPYDYVVIDEAQDIGVSHLKFFSALASKKRDGLFFAGDLGQRIFQQPFSWKSLGVDIRGRSRTLRINYRTSHQIRRQADRLLGPETVDIDGNEENRSDTISVFNGPPPDMRTFKDQDLEINAVRGWLIAQLAAGVSPNEIGVFVRSANEMSRAEAAVSAAGLKFKILDDHVETISGHASICTMHLAKGLEFRSVVVMACDDEVIPSQQRIEDVTDDADLQEVYDTERQLLYVACTRARDHLLITAVDPSSEFLDDLVGRAK
ncbi:DNA helicase [Polynucleobacter paneuropaeus]|uniref:DNA 3'-5' helicase n=1 Tax=Polynucleobacter paneuropaeus TaxID=2527775 RepID=A0ABX9FCP7_9BURK|nr:UvrD-helicase domain-containing protein [Polynucleobacter paneuropaeus]RAZ42106.1 DNA helicase [Polynucleobacter paneuropaeus]